MRWILSLKKPMKYREFATALAVNLPKSVGKPTTTKNSGCKSAKECGNTNNNKKPVCRDFDFDPKKSVRKTKEIPRICHRSACKFPTKKCGKITNKKVCRVFDFEKKKNVKKTKEIPRIRHRSACKFMANK